MILAKVPNSPVKESKDINMDEILNKEFKRWLLLLLFDQ